MQPFGFQALGTQWWLEIWDDISDEERSAAYSRAADVAATFEQRYSRFLPNSEISRLNRDRILTEPADDTRELLDYGVDLFKRSKSTFNFLTGHILEARGYDADLSFEDTGSLKLAPGNPTTDLIFTEESIALTFGNIDLGGYGKGWCIDLVAQFFKDEIGLQQFLINGGGDIYVTHRNGEGIEIHLQDPHELEKLIGSTILKDCGFAASSPHQRRWSATQTDGSIAHQNHIVGDLTKDVIYLTAPTATDADAFATALLQSDDHTAKQLAKENKLTIL